jgi:ankyrin repeat protein
MKMGDATNYLFDKVLAIASEPGRVRGQAAIDISQALSDSIRLKYIPWITKLINGPLELPKEVLHNIYTDDPEIVDLVVGRTATPLYVNRLNSEGRTPLITAVLLKNYYFAKKLLGLPFIKTAIQDRLGKTALHYAAVESYIYEKSHGKDGGEAFEMVKLLVARNPVLAGLRDHTKKGPSNPAYVGANSATRKYIKARKYRFMTPRNSNRNIKE